MILMLLDEASLRTGHGGRFTAHIARICIFHLSHKTKGSGQSVFLRKPWLTVYRAHLFAYNCKQDQGFSTNCTNCATRISIAYAHANGFPHASACFILRRKSKGSGKIAPCGSHSWRFTARICLHRSASRAKVSQQRTLS